MGTSGILKLWLFGDLLNNSVALGAYPSVLFGATTILTGSSGTLALPASASRRYWAAMVTLQNVSATNSQRVSAVHWMGSPTGDFSFRETGASVVVQTAQAYGTTAEASSAALTLAYRFRLCSTATTVDMQLRHAYLELTQ